MNKIENFHTQITIVSFNQNMTLKHLKSNLRPNFVLLHFLH